MSTTVPHITHYTTPPSNLSTYLTLLFLILLSGGVGVGCWYIYPGF